MPKETKKTKVIAFITTNQTTQRYRAGKKVTRDRQVFELNNAELKAFRNDHFIAVEEFIEGEVIEPEDPVVTPEDTDQTEDHEIEEIDEKEPDEETEDEAPIPTEDALKRMNKAKLAQKARELGIELPEGVEDNKDVTKSMIATQIIEKMSEK